MQSRSKPHYYLDAWLARDGSVMFHVTDPEAMHLCARSILTKYTFEGSRATVTIFSLSECIFRFAALNAAKNFMSGNYRQFNLKTMEWTNGEPH